MDLTFDAMVSEVDLAKLRIFISDVMFDRDSDRGIAIPFGKNDCTVFRKVLSTEDVIEGFAPALRTSQQAEAFRIALQMLGDLTGFGISYFDYDNTGYVKTATEVSSDNSALMRNVRRHENALGHALVGIIGAYMVACRLVGIDAPEAGEMRIDFDDSIVQDKQAEKDQDMREVGVTMAPWEYRAKWCGEDTSLCLMLALAVEEPAPSRAAVSFWPISCHTDGYVIAHKTAPSAGCVLTPERHLPERARFDASTGFLRPTANNYCA